MTITTLRIFPAIGIARLGNSSEFFIGSEIPDVRPVPEGGYKDASCRIKRQAARFRLYAYDENDALVIENGKPKEITMADASIKWTVELANKKSAWRMFDGPDPNKPFRNASVVDRSTLEITPGPRSLDQPNQAAGFNTGKFLKKIVPLGEMRTEADGRLLVVGGFGNSESVPPGMAIVSYANNDGWHDDVSDGPVTAEVTLNGQANPIPVKPAWVLCPPPDFAPSIDSITTLYDVLFQVAVNKGFLTAPVKPSFNNDIFPILQRVLSLKPVNQPVSSSHFNFASAFPPGGTAAARQAISNRLRDPNNPNGPGQTDMPLLYDDNEQGFHTITKLQYSAMQKWKGVAGTDWTNDWTGVPPLPPTEITPDGLTRAALEACVGAAFYPGIECGWFMRDTYNYTEAFRLDHTGRAAGDVSKQMACPWQADFSACYDYGLSWWPAQRPDDVFPESGGGPVRWERDVATTMDLMIKNWHKLGFIVKKSGQMVETERRVVCTNIFLVTDKSSFSEDEVAGVLTGGSPAKFPDALYVIAEGFLPSELGVTTSNPTPAQLVPIAPSLTFKRENNTIVPNMQATPQKLLLQDNSLPSNLRQRFTFVYQVEFVDNAAFNDNQNNPIETQIITVAATKNAASQNFTSTGFVTLFHQPNPYMLDGPTSWLSTDVRVFQVVDGAPASGVTLGPVAADTPAAGQTAALNFVQQLVTNFNNLAGQNNHPFDSILVNQQTSKLELSEKVANKRVFNFAVAQVRYKGKVLSANDVKVFFRLFTTAATGLDYNMNSTYRRTPSLTDPVSLLGLQGGYVVTIPCYGRGRVDSSAAAIYTQVDDLNKQTLSPAGADEFHAYFGCWLDFNQVTPQFPLQPNPPDGPWNAGRQSIQQLIRGQHQCLVAEVYFKDDPVPAGTTPASNDNLAQRNLAIVESDNPGQLATHTVQHTFEIKATTPTGALAPAFVGRSLESLAPIFQEAGPDELMIRWQNLAPGTRMTLYMPDLDSDEVLELAGQNYDVTHLQRVDSHTIECLPGDVTYVPIPPGRKKNIAALLTLELPENITRRQAFEAVIHQISGSPRKILGAFQFSVPVSDKAALLEPEIRKLSVMRHIARTIPQDDQWHHVFVRYLDQIANRVRGFGGDPDRVGPAADGSGRSDFVPEGSEVDEVSKRCSRYGWLFSIALALLVLVAALHPLKNYLVEGVVALFVIVVMFLWRKVCRPLPCRIITASLFGLVGGALFVAILLLLGLATQSGLVILATTAIILGLLVVVGVWQRCFKL